MALQWKGTHQGALTCYQERGASVVDYVAISANHLTWVDDKTLTVTRSPWSDHCHITITVTNPTEPIPPVNACFSLRLAPVNPIQNLSSEVLSLAMIPEDRHLPVTGF